MFSLLIYAKPQGLGSFEKMFLVTMLQSARREFTIFFLDYLWRTRVQLDLGHYFYNYALHLNLILQFRLVLCIILSVHVYCHPTCRLLVLNSTVALLATE